MRKLGALAAVLVLAGVGVLGAGTVGVFKFRQDARKRRWDAYVTVQTAALAAILRLKANEAGELHAEAAPSFRAATTPAEVAEKVRAFLEGAGESTGMSCEEDAAQVLDLERPRTGPGTAMEFRILFAKHGNVPVELDLERVEGVLRLTRLALRPTRGPSLELPTQTARVEGKP